jgi:hypothetical protein
LTNPIGLVTFNQNGGFIVTGGGTLYQTSNVATNFNVVTGPLTVSGATYRVTDVSSSGGYGNLGTQALYAFTLDGGILDYAGASATTMKPITLTANGGTIDVEVGVTTLTAPASVQGSGSLTKTGPGTLAFTVADTNTFNGMNISAGTVRASYDGDLGAAGGSVTVGPLGTLEFAGGATTSRTFMLNGGTMTVDSGQGLSLINANVGGGFLHGPGTFNVNNGTLLSGNSTSNNAIVNVVGAGTLTNFSNSGTMSLTQGQGVTATFSTFINQGSGSITVGAQSPLNVGDFQTYGVLTITPATITENFSQTTLMTNVGTTPLNFNGGSRTFIGTAATAVFPANWPDSSLRGLPTFVAGIDLNGKNAVVAGGLFVNNGYVEDSTNNFQGTATVVADFGALVKGAGYFQNSVQTINGGKFQAGNSPGKATFGTFVFGPGGVNNYVFAIDDATGAAGPSPDAAGHVSGWGLVRVGGPPVVHAGLSTQGNLTWTATPTDKLTVAIETLLNPTTVGNDVAGLMADFDPTRSYSWPAVEWTGSYAGPAEVATLDASTSFDLTGFANPVAGVFGWSLDAGDHALSLTYTPSAVPEPGTLTLTSLTAAGLVLRRRRKRTIAAAPARASVPGSGTP